MQLIQYTCHSASNQNWTFTPVAGTTSSYTITSFAGENQDVRLPVGYECPYCGETIPQAFVDVNVTGTLNLLQAAVAAGHDRFVFTSTTSLMVSQAIRQEDGSAAVWLDEEAGALAPSW